VADILVVDDDQSVATAFERFLDAEGHACRLASSAAEGLEQIEARPPNVVIMDIRMPGTDGLQALRELRSRFPGICVVMMTAFGTSQTSIDAIREGAFDYLTKPLDLERLRDVIAKALAAQSATDETTAVVAPPEQVALVGDSPAMLEVYKLIGRLATNSAPALVTGERGTGKHLVVATIHENSDRRDKPLVAINCASVTDSELEVALSSQEAGTLELADVHLLPGVQQIVIAQRLAAARTRSSVPPPTVRVIGTSDRNLADETTAGSFVQQLYDELAIVTLRLPPLRERRDDIPLLVRQFVHRFNVELNRQIRGVDDQVARALQQHPWPGNVGELERVIKRASIVARSQVITMDDLGDSLSGSRFAGGPDAVPALERAVRSALHDRLVQENRGASSVFHDVVDAVETTLVREALVITNGNQLKAAEILGVNRATVRKKMPEG
jgi:two-component system nitrogen regulation response regulator GlnG